MVTGMTRNCAYCDRPFVPASTGNGRNRIYCSERCRRDRFAASDRGHNRCRDCGGWASLGHQRCDQCNHARRAERVAAEARAIEQAWADGTSIAEMAGRFGRSAGSMGVKITRLRADGYDLPLRHSGYDPDVVAQTVDLYRRGLSLAKVGERLGVTEGAVHNRLKKAGEPRRPAHRHRSAA